ncbi:MAG: hypothetical protein J5J04_17795 [Anaerolineae bacterium]|jgi:uncharacterized protein YcaQ|nr:hypothetical protein [Anaerolineae bacterium]NOG51462.1 hypothetical protein [Chloroflexota bacterium]OQY80989.1 MAG: hypothetical protein B6D42_12060 [Anaerolineae bacterium UTCFX5]GIK30297.1 MAG: hypothetical protein BroJett007_34350 [Chloroflexota bacterium]
MEPLSLEAVRGLMIAAQGLIDTPQPPATKDDVLRRTLRACAVWHETPQVVVREATDPDLTDLLSD